MIKVYMTVAMIGFVAIAAVSAPAEPIEAPEGVPKTMHDLPLVFYEDFSEGADRWTVTDPDAWEVIEENGNPVFALVKKFSDYEPPHRSPLNIALVDDIVVGDFVLDARIKSTEPEYGHRDMCVYFGYNDPANFYYVHIAPEADPVANSILKVNDAPRVSIADYRTEGTQWIDDHYHWVRVVRHTDSGRIEVYFDNMDDPIMTAEDTTFLKGQVGFGSFDDTGVIDDIRLWGTLIEE